MQERSAAVVREFYGKLQSMANNDMDLQPLLFAYCEANPGVARYVLTDFLRELLNDSANGPLWQIEDSLVLRLLQATLQVAPREKVQEMYDRMIATMVNPSILPALPYCQAAQHVRSSESQPSKALQELSYFTGVNNDKDRTMPLNDLPAHITCPKEQYDFWNPTVGSKHWEDQWLRSTLLVYVYAYCAITWLELTCHSLICR